MSARGTSRVSVRTTSFCASARDPHGSLAWQWARVHTLDIVVRMSHEMTPDKSLQANVGWRLH